VKKIYLKKRTVQRTEYIAKGAELNHVSQLISDRNVELYDEADPSKPIIILKNKNDFGWLFQELKKIKKWDSGTRNNGNRSISRVYGYQPRMPPRRQDYCSMARFYKDYPQIFDDITSWIRSAEKDFEEISPELYLPQKELVRGSVLEEWRIAGTSFTSGIINKSNPLGYHTDTGNIKNAWSMMLVLRAGVDGGQLVVPELDVALSLDHCSQLFFDGQSLIHGVTPIKKTSADGERFSVVAYSLKQMCKCLHPVQEIERAQVRAVAAMKHRRELQEKAKE
jgi:hypothetical protein